MYSSKKVYDADSTYIEVKDYRIDRRLSVEENCALVLLHEVAHLTGKPGDDRNNQQLSDEFNRSIARDCFGKK